MSLFRNKFLSIILPGVLALLAVLYLTVVRDHAADIYLEKKAVERGDIQAVVAATGTLNPVNLVDVGCEVTGRIAVLYADFNSVVKQGQVLAELDQAPFSMRVSQAEASLKVSDAALARAEVQMDQAKGQYERAVVLFDKQVISIEVKEAAQAAYKGAVAEYAAARSNREQARSQVDSAKLDLDRTVIRAPLDGVIINRAVSVGQTVVSRATAPLLFQIADDLERLRIECRIRESDVGHLRKGQPVTFTVDAHPDVLFKGVVNHVRFASELAQNVVTYIAVVDVEKPEVKLLPRMTARVVIEVGSARNVLLVPSAALRFEPPTDLAESIAVDWGKEGGPGRGPDAGEDARDRRAGDDARGPHGGPEERGHRADADAGNVVRSVWVLAENGGIRRVLVLPGMSDLTMTEIRQVVDGQLKEGDTLVLWARTPETLRISRESSLRRPRFH